MTQAPIDFTLIASIFFLAGLVKGIMGMGMPTVAMGLLGLLMAPVQAAALLVAPAVTTNIWQMFAGPHLRASMQRIGPLMVGTVIGTIGGIGFLASSHSASAGVALGVVLAAYALFALISPRFVVPRTSESWLGPIVGLLTGLISGSTGVFVIPMVPYISSLDLEREQLIQALGGAFTASALALGVGRWWTDHYPIAALSSSLLALIPAFIGMMIGQRLRAKIPPVTFRRVFLYSILALGLYMALR